MTVRRINAYSDHEVVKTLKHLLSQAESGHVRGLAWAIKTGPHTHTVGLAGQYWTDPVEALGCIARMEYKLNTIISDLEGHPERKL